MPQQSAGVLMYRHGDAGIEVLLAHPGGPFWRSRDDGAWGIPKGGANAGETPDDTARREFHEEVGLRVDAALQPLGRLRQKGGKWVEAFAVEGDFDPADLVSIAFEMEWPPRSGRVAAYPEVDRVQWFALDAARTKMLESQRPLLDRLIALLDAVR